MRLIVSIIALVLIGIIAMALDTGPPMVDTDRVIIVDSASISTPRTSFLERSDHVDVVFTAPAPLLFQQNGISHTANSMHAVMANYRQERREVPHPSAHPVPAVILATLPR